MAKPCSCCRQHPALYYSWKKKRVRADRQHLLCFRCHRSLTESFNQTNEHEPK